MQRRLLGRESGRPRRGPFSLRFPPPPDEQDQCGEDGDGDDTTRDGNRDLGPQGQTLVGRRSGYEPILLCEDVVGDQRQSGHGRRGRGDQFGGQVRVAWDVASDGRVVDLKTTIQNDIRSVAALTRPAKRGNRREEQLTMDNRHSPS